MRNAWCTSTNYKMSSKKDGKGTCELNKHDVALINDQLLRSAGSHFLDATQGNIRFFQIQAVKMSRKLRI